MSTSPEARRSWVSGNTALVVGVIAIAGAGFGSEAIIGSHEDAQAAPARKVAHTSHVHHPLRGRLHQQLPQGPLEQLPPAVLTQPILTLSATEFQK